jgi:Protein of unknown function (DUF3810)
MPPRVRNLSRRTAIGAGIVAAAVAGLFAPLPAPLIEAWYSRGLYPPLQRSLTAVSNLVPFALLDVAGIAALALWVAMVVRIARSMRAAPALATIASRLVVFTATSYLVFLAVWGLNYRRVPLEEKLEFDQALVTREAARALGGAAIRIVNARYTDAHAASPELAALVPPFDRAQRMLGADATARPGVSKRSLLGLYFRWAAIDGMTDPFFLEVIVNPDVLPIERPFVLAHEWAHLAGYADESEANFVAWLTCAGGDALSQYSGWLALYAHVSGGLPREDRRLLAEQLDPGVRQDLIAINARISRSAPVVRHAAQEVYDSYLKANRVERGVLSYDAVVRLVLGTRFDPSWTPRLRTRE